MQMFLSKNLNFFSILDKKADQTKVQSACKDTAFLAYMQTILQFFEFNSDNSSNQTDGHLVVGAANAGTFPIRIEKHVIRIFYPFVCRRPIITVRAYFTDTVVQIFFPRSWQENRIAVGTCDGIACFCPFPSAFAHQFHPLVSIRYFATETAEPILCIPIGMKTLFILHFPLRSARQSQIDIIFGTCVAPHHAN